MSLCWRKTQIDSACFLSSILTSGRCIRRLKHLFGPVTSSLLYLFFSFTVGLTLTPSISAFSLRILLSLCGPSRPLFFHVLLWMTPSSRSFILLLCIGKQSARDDELWFLDTKAFKPCCLRQCSKGKEGDHCQQDTDVLRFTNTITCKQHTRCKICKICLKCLRRLVSCL